MIVTLSSASFGNSDAARAMFKSKLCAMLGVPENILTVKMGASDLHLIVEITAANASAIASRAENRLSDSEMQSLGATSMTELAPEPKGKNLNVPLIVGCAGAALVVLLVLLFAARRTSKDSVSARGDDAAAGHPSSPTIAAPTQAPALSSPLVVVVPVVAEPQHDPMFVVADQEMVKKPEQSPQKQLEQPQQLQPVATFNDFEL